MASTGSKDLLDQSTKSVMTMTLYREMTVIQWHETNPSDVHSGENIRDVSRG